MIARLSRLEASLSARKVFIAALAALLLLRWYVLLDPPYWDALVGAFPQGLWLARHGFDAFRLMTSERTYVDGGPNVYPFSVYPYLVAVLYWLGLAPQTIFLVLHLVSFAFAAALIASTFELARALLTPPLALSSTLLLFVAPLFTALACEINMDMPLAACTLASFVKLHQRRVAASWSWALLALLVKPTGVILIAANLMILVVRAASCSSKNSHAGANGDAGARRAAWLGAGAYLGLLLVFAAELVLISTFARSPAFVSIFGGLSSFFGRRLWLVPEYGVALCLYLASVPYLLVRLRNKSLRPLELELAIFLCAYVLFYCQYTNTLPRYFLQSYPFLIVAMGMLVARWTSARAALSMIAIGALYCLINLHGRFYPAERVDWKIAGDERALYGNDGYVLERSMEYRDDLLLDRALVARLAAWPKDRTVFVANWPLIHVLAFPEFGYTEQAFRVASCDNPLTFDEKRAFYRDLYDTGGVKPRKKTAETIVWVISPNTFISPQSRVLPEVDQIIETVESGAHRAFIIARTGWE